MKEDRVTALIAKLYDAALDATQWPRVVHTFAAAFGAESCAMFQVNLAEGSADFLGRTENFDAKATREYEAYYNQKDLWAIAIARLPTGRVLLNSELVPEKEFLHSEIFADYAKRMGIFRCVGSVFPLERERVGFLSIHRPRHARAFGPDDKCQLDMLLPHVSRALILQRRLAGLTQNTRIVAEALENLALATIVVDAEAAVLFANSTAERLLRAGLGVSCRNGRLTVTDAGKQEQLRSLIRRAGAAARGRPGDAGGVVALPHSRGRPLALQVCPVPPHALAAGAAVAAALVTFGDPDATASVSPQALRELYGVTAAEARLVAAIVAGERLEEYADRHGISLNTVKTLLKRVFAKTGHARQAELLREILTNPALLTKGRLPGKR